MNDEQLAQALGRAPDVRLAEARQLLQQMADELELADGTQTSGQPPWLCCAAIGAVGMCATG